jgi:hypothetical protein
MNAGLLLASWFRAKLLCIFMPRNKLVLSNTGMHMRTLSGDKNNNCVAAEEVQPPSQKGGMDAQLNALRATGQGVGAEGYVRLRSLLTCSSFQHPARQ